MERALVDAVMLVGVPVLIGLGGYFAYALRIAADTAAHGRTPRLSVGVWLSGAAVAVLVVTIAVLMLAE